MDKPWKVFFAFAGIFLAGVLAGSLVTLRWGKGFSERRPMSEQYGPRMMQRLVSELDLSADQQEKLKPIIASASEELRDLRRSTQRSSAAVIVRMQGEIAAVLTPAQKAKFDELVARQRERVRHFMEERARRQKDKERPASP